MNQFFDWLISMQVESFSGIYPLLTVVIVVIAGYYDIRWRRIPNWLTFSGLLAGFLLNALIVQRHSVWHGLGVAAVGFTMAMLINFPLYLLHARGAGDVKLLAAMGAITGWAPWLAIFLVSSILGGVLAIILMTAKGRVRKTFWNLGYIIVQIVRLRSPYLKSPELDVNSKLAFRLPQGAVIALGTLLVLGRFQFS